jgi:hypothetical protein
MHHFPKSLISAIALMAMTGTAVAQDPPDGAGAPAADPAAPAPAPMAEGSNKGTKTIGIDVVGMLPLSDYGDAADFVIGGLGRFEFGVNEMLSITGRVGFLYHIGTPDGTDLLMVPILAGVKYSIGTSGLFAYGEAGLNYTRVSIDFMGSSASDSETNFALGGGVGYQTGKIQARGGLLLPDVGEAGDAQGLMISVGYNVAAL